MFHARLKILFVKKSYLCELFIVMGPLCQLGMETGNRLIECYHLHLLCFLAESAFADSWQGQSV